MILFFNHLHQLFAKLYVKFKDQSAVAILEFALVLPIMMTLLVGVVELSNYVYASQKNQSAAIIASNLIADQNELSKPVIDDIMAAVAKSIQGAVDVGGDLKSSNNFAISISILQQVPTGIAGGDNTPPDIFVVYNSSTGATGDLLDSPFSYSAGDPNGDGEDYVTNNSISASELVGYEFVPGSTNQIVIIETSSIYQPLMGNYFTENILPAGFKWQVSYSSTPTNVRKGRFSFRDDGSEILTAAP